MLDADLVEWRWTGEAVAECGTTAVAEVVYEPVERLPVSVAQLSDLEIGEIGRVYGYRHLGILGVLFGLFKLIKVE